MTRTSHASMRHAATLVVLASCGNDGMGFHDVPRAETLPDIMSQPTMPGAACDFGSGEATGGCSAGQTCLLAAQGFPNGYCAVSCPRQSCPSGSACVVYPSIGPYCAVTCTTSADCRNAEGYVCTQAGSTSATVCTPNSDPIGRQSDGGACYVTGGDGGTGPFLAPLPLVRFSGASTNASQGRLLSLLAENETSLALDPTSRAGALVGFAGFLTQDMATYWRGGISRVAADASYDSSIELRDRDYPDVTDTQLAFDRTGRLHALLVAQDTSRPANPIRYASSDDGGMTFPTLLTTPMNVFPEAACGLRCEHPALAIGTSVDGSSEVLYAATIAGFVNPTSVVFVTSPTTTPSFPSTAFTIATTDIETDASRTPATVSVASGGPGVVLVSWVDTNTMNTGAGLGDPLNRVRLRISTDAGMSFGTKLEVTQPGDSPVAYVPWVGSGGTATHVVYVSGGLTGQWNVTLATSSDAGTTWRWRTVNDEPAPACATHAFPGLAVDPASGDTHVVWLDNRYGPGEIAYALCPADATMPCSRNQLVSGTPFAFSTEQNPPATPDTSEPGDRASLVLAGDGSLWAAWTDSRAGSAGAYLAHSTE